MKIHSQAKFNVSVRLADFFSGLKLLFICILSRIYFGHWRSYDQYRTDEGGLMLFLWIGFIAIVFLLLAFDLGVLNRKSHVIGIKEALLWTLFWVCISLCFNLLCYFMYEHHWLGIGLNGAVEVTGRQAALQFLTGYIIEKSLSLDNIFVIALIFNYFHVPPQYQHRVLFWGILGALIMRGAMIAAGTALITRFEWIIYVFGGLLILSAIKMAFDKHEKTDLDKNVFVKIAKRIFLVSKKYEKEHFFTRINGRKAITPLFLALIVVEGADVIFAVDSIPAIFAITIDPFIVFTSNVFAILGLRSLYFALAAIMDRFYYLKASLIVLMAYIGVKMLVSHYIKIPTTLSLAIICGVLVVGILASGIKRKYQKKHSQA